MKTCLRWAFALLALAGLLSGLSSGPVWSQPTPSLKTAVETPLVGVPVVRLDKTRFATQENIRFWVGVEAPGGAPILHAGGPCLLTITRPDGTRKVDSLGWPLDGPPGRGFIGGWGLGTERPQVGRYTLALAFDGRTTPPASFTVEDVPLLQKITATFAFAFHPTLNAPNSVAVFTVRNDTDQTLRFPHRDGINAPVSAELVRTDGDLNAYFFYPGDQLLDAEEPKAPTFSYDTFSWALAAKVPMITLRPGETYRQRLPLAPLRATLASESPSKTPPPPGQYRLTLSTQLEVLVGEPDGPWASLGAVAVPVSTTAAAGITP